MCNTVHVALMWSLEVYMYDFRRGDVWCVYVGCMELMCTGVCVCRVVGFLESNLEVSFAQALQIEVYECFRP